MKKFVSVLLSIAMIFSLVACTSSSTTEVTSSTASTETTTTDAKEETAEEVTLRFMWWGGDDRHEPTLEAIALYEEQTGVKIQAEYQGWDGYEQKMMTQLASGTAPDIIQLDSPWLLTFSESGLFVDLNTRGDIIDFDQFDAEFLETGCEVNGVLSGLPTGINAMRMVVNKEFMDAYGIDTERQYTWDEWFALGEEIHAANPDHYLMAWDVAEPWYFFEDYIRNKTGDFIVGDDFTIHASDADIQESLEMVLKMYSTNSSLPMSEVLPFPAAMDTSPKWINGEIGGLCDYTSKLDVWMSSTDAEIATMSVPLPTDAAMDGATYRPAQLYGVPEASENQDEALKFINWMLTDPDAIALQGTARSAPATAIGMETLEETGSLSSVLVHALEEGAENKAPAAPFVMGDSEMIQIFNDIFQSVVMEQSTPEQATADLISRLEMRLVELSVS